MEWHYDITVEPIMTSEVIIISHNEDRYDLDFKYQPDISQDILLTSI